MKKKLSFLLASGLILSQLSFRTVAYTDVNPGDWYYNDVLAMASGGYLTGKTPTTFGAGDSLSNAEFCAMIANAYYGETLAVFLASNETNRGEWYLPYVSAVYARGGMDNTQIGIFYGNNHQWGTFVDSAITRYDMASMITSLLESRGVASLSEGQINTILADLSDTVETRYEKAVATAYYYGFISGYPDGGFHGGEDFIRGAAAVVLANLVRHPLISEENVNQYYTEGNNNNNNNGGDSNDNTGGSTDTTGLHSYVLEVFELVNQERENYGIFPLTIDLTLCKMAQYKSDEMSILNYLDHTSPTYGVFSNILSNSGVVVQRARENLARGQRSPEEVVTAWMNSTDHRTNLLSTDVGKIGIGFTEDGYYWSQLFTDNSANTEVGFSGDLSGDTGGNSGGTGGNSSGDIQGDHFGMEIPFFQYNNYLEVGYDPSDFTIEIPINNTGDFPLVFKNLYIYGAHGDVFTGTITSKTIPVGGSAKIVIVPDANLPVGQYTATVELSMENLSSLFQTVNIFVANVHEAPEPAPETEYVPEPDFEVPELNPEEEAPLAQNTYNVSSLGSAEVVVSSTQQSQWHYETYGETKVTLQLSQPLPEGTELESAFCSLSGVSVTSARMEENRSEIHVTFQGLPYSYQTVDLSLSFREGNRVVMSPAPISVSVMINGKGTAVGEFSPYSLKKGDTVEMLIADVNVAEYGFVVKNAQGESVSADSASQYGARSSGVYTIGDQDLYFSIGTK